MEMLRLAKSSDQCCEFGTVLLAEGRKFQSESGARFRVAHYCVRADLAFGNKEIQPSNCARWPRLRRLNEQSAHAHIADQ